MLVKLRQELLEVGIKDIDAKLDILDVAAEQLNEERLMYKVGEADKGAGLLAVSEDRACQEAHILDVADVGPVD